MTALAGPNRSILLPTHAGRAAGSRQPSRARLAVVSAGMAIAVAGFIAAQGGARALPATGPVAGEFRLAPGNLQPLGVVVRVGAQGAQPGEFRLGPGNQTPPGVVIPAH